MLWVYGDRQIYRERERQRNRDFVGEVGSGSGGIGLDVGRGDGAEVGRGVGGVFGSGSGIDRDVIDGVGSCDGEEVELEVGDEFCLIGV